MRTLKILVVDDEVLVSKATQAILESFGHNVTVANSGEDALELLGKRDDQSKFDLLIVDLQMGGIDGIETIELARHILPNAVFWLWTSNIDNQTVVKAYRSGASLVIGKPLGLEGFRSLIQDSFESE